MMQVEVVRVVMPLKKEFVVAHGRATQKTNVLAILNNRYTGEAAASVQYGPTPEEIERDLAKAVVMLQTKRRLGVKTMHEINKLEISAIAKSALSGMVLHYLSGERNKYPWEILKLHTPVGIRSSTTVSIDDPARMIAAIKESTYPIIKIKMGTESDTELLDHLERGTDKELRVDANGGWTPEKAEEMIFRLAKLGVRVIEQPTNIEHIKDWPLLKGNHEVELIADEGMDTVSDYRRLGEHCDGVNVKMEKAGGILPAMQLAKRARADHKKVMLGCMVESSIGIAQSVYMSGMADYFDLDGPLLLQHDIARGIEYRRETIHVDREIIGGPALKRDLVQKYISE